MARRTWAELAAAYADNTSGDITAADLRDGFDSLEPHVAATAPGMGDDSAAGFDRGHAWVNTSTTPDSLYVCLDASVGAAVWALVYPQAGGGGSGDIELADGLVIVKHGSTAATARPAAGSVYWQGSVAPTNRAVGDWWLNTNVYD